MKHVFDDQNLVDSIKKSKILLVGGGGIGCEVIKNLLLTGFSHVSVIDLDTIDVSNLNRQFLFNKSHVGESKAKVAANVAHKNFAHGEHIDVKAIHNSIQSQEYDVSFFKSFSIVINALDNISARSHVNRMCLAANVPLIESGSEGYFGQVFTIKKHVSACYECTGQRQDQRTFASCTIRNTPSLPIHCIVWAKHLFAQLFGEDDPDNDVSPDLSDAEVASQVNELMKEISNDKKPETTREWAQKNNYDPIVLFNKLFCIDIQYLLKMVNLWEKRRKPTPLHFDDLAKEHFTCQPSSSTSSEVCNGKTYSKLKDQKIWTIRECYEVFSESLKELKERFNKEGNLIWDKDDETALNFVAAVSNLRSHCFGIEMKSKFDVKSMAGNIIPAISSTNSIIGGLITLQAIKLLQNLKHETNDEKLPNNSFEDNAIKNNCKQIFLRKVSLNRPNLISSYELFDPNPNCLVCSGRVPEIDITLSLNEVLMIDFVEQVLFKKLNFVCPDICIDGTAKVIWSKDEADMETEEEREISKKKLMSDFKSLKNDVRLRVNDLLQDYSVLITLKDEKFDLNENEGLFYKIIINEGEIKTESKNKESTNEIKDEAEEAFEKTKMDSSKEDELLRTDQQCLRTNELNDISKIGEIAYEENSQEIICIDDEDEEDSEDIMVMAEYAGETMVTEVENGGDVETDNSCDIIEVREKRKVEENEGDFLLKKRRLD
ncbi:SUMO-activating enzyme subunit 2-like protein [Dinothrombium tinctorium]|uniref:SUMO-activating enzyme subunit 2-like protein n=1 Tax=Dinothrombium tinctorium TaxID=1965070 RepID=A0A3S4QI51_9ACAR|nr:SUMO-activating enzyme subunit 2-like protein [Dinothrombium tinctorium]